MRLIYWKFSRGRIPGLSILCIWHPSHPFVGSSSLGSGGVINVFLFFSLCPFVNKDDGWTNIVRIYIYIYRAEASKIRPMCRLQPSPRKSQNVLTRKQIQYYKRQWAKSDPHKRYIIVGGGEVEVVISGSNGHAMACFTQKKRDTWINNPHFRQAWGWFFVSPWLSINRPDDKGNFLPSPFSSADPSPLGGTSTLRSLRRLIIPGSLLSVADIALSTLPPLWPISDIRVGSLVPFHM